MPSNLIKRTIFGLLFITTVILGSFYYKETFGVVFLFLMLVGVYEFYNMMSLIGATPRLWQALVIGTTIFVAAVLHSFYHYPLLYLVAVVEIFLVAISETFRKTKTPVQNLGALLGIVAYISVPLALLSYIFKEPNAVYLVLSLFFIVWSFDSGAYIIGSLLGRTKLCERISPKKTWEGLFGGLAIALLVVFLLPQKYIPFSLIERLCFATIIVAFSTFGDLFQSMLKRNVNIKDSGDLLPGHGGILDRIDSLLFAIPITFVYLELIKK